ncbi:hypothetical protein [Streptomyces albus]|uniref:hypothetical protein n=1 Tax=Streptomyces albus TaxID=1888 RepID=UPI00345360F7
MSHSPTTTATGSPGSPTGSPSGLPDAGGPPEAPGAPTRRPVPLVAMLCAAVLSALSSALGALMVYLGGKDLADENVRKAVASDPSAVGLPSGTRPADIARMAGTAWDSVVTDWQGTMSARALLAAALAVALLLCALSARSGNRWARLALTLVALTAAAVPHVFILRDAAPVILHATSLCAAVLAVAAVVLCWLPSVGRYAATPNDW